MKNNTAQTLSKRLFFSFAISCLLPMALVSCFLSYLIGNHQYQEVNNQATNNMKLISAYITKYINDVDNILKAPYYHTYFQSKVMVDTLTPYEQNEISAEIGKLLQLTTYSRDDFGDLLVMSEGDVLYFNSTDWYQYLPTVQPLTSRTWYTEAEKKDGRVAIVPVERDDGAPSIDTSSFYISRRLNNMFLVEQTNIIMVRLGTSSLDTLFSSLTSAVPLMIAFTNDNDELIYSSSPIDRELAVSLAQPIARFKGSSWTNYTQKLEKYPLTVHLLLDRSYIHGQIAAFLMLTILCYLIGVVVAYILFWRNNHWIENPTYHIKTILKELETGNLLSRCQPLAVTEFNEIGLSVNAMAHQLQEKIKNEYELTLSQKSLQLQALQSQIQPHFIINTIYSFITLNQIGEHDALNDAFYAFARMLRYVLGKDNGTTIGKELDFLNNYCSLCLLRFGDRLSYTIHCDESITPQELPKLLLQPLVENAVIHGVEPSELPCQLTIKVSKQQDIICILIEDNGVGFTEEQLHAPNSIGIKNVETRLSIWNEAASFTIERKAGKTIQTLLIPPPC